MIFHLHSVFHFEHERCSQDVKQQVEGVNWEKVKQRTEFITTLHFIRVVQQYRYQAVAFFVL